MYFLADITKKVPIYVHFVIKLQTFELRALGGSFCRKFGWGAVCTFLWPGSNVSLVNPLLPNRYHCMSIDWIIIGKQ